MKGCILLVSLCLLALLSGAAAEKDPEIALKSELLCSQCSKCDTKKCPPSESYPDMTAWDDSLKAAASQSDYVSANDRGVYSEPDIKGGQSAKYNSYYGWQSSSGSVSGMVKRCYRKNHNVIPSHRFSNYMDKCSGGLSYLTANKQGKVSLRSLKSLEDIAQADWKLINPPKKLNHRKFGFWVNGSTGKCLTVLGGKEKNGQWEYLGASLMAQIPINFLPSDSIITRPSAAVAFTIIDIQPPTPKQNK